MSHIPHVIEPDEHSRLGKVVATWIVFATLAAAVVGYAESRALTSQEDAARTAELLGVKMTNSRISSEHQFDARYETFAVADALRYRASLARWRTVSGDPAATSDQNALLVQAAQADDSAAAPISLTSSDGPYLDPAFPAQASEQGLHRFYLLEAQQDAANAEATDWGGDVSAYTAVLTVFAVALYLLGFSFRLAPRERTAFTILGICFSLTGMIWGAVIYVSSPGSADEGAAQAYADGSAAADTALSAADHRRAAADFRRAVRARPDFALAYMKLGDAVWDAGTPQQNATFANLVEPKSLAESTEDYTRAYALGLQRSDLLASLSFGEFLLALQKPAGSSSERSLLNRALHHTRRAIDDAETSARAWKSHPESAKTMRYAIPPLRFNEGVVDLALGREDDARRADLLAVAEARQTFSGKPALVAGAIGDLETLAARRPTAEMRGAVRRLKELVVGAAWPSAQGHTPARALGITGGRADVWPTYAQLRDFRLVGFGRHDVLTSIWYTRHRLGWYVQEGLSGIVHPQRDPSTNTPWFGTTLKGSCLPTGPYRVEVYGDGRLLRTYAATTQFDSQWTWGSPRATDVELCAPPDWSRAADSIEGVLEGYSSPDRASGAYVLRLPPPAGGWTLAHKVDAEMRAIARETGTTIGAVHEGRASVLRDGRGIRWAAADARGGDLVFGFAYGPMAQFAKRAPLYNVFFSLRCTHEKCEP